MKKLLLFLLTFCFLLSAAACTPGGGTGSNSGSKPSGNDSKKTEETSQAATAEESVVTEISESLDQDVNTLQITCSEGTDACWSFTGTTLTFSGLTADTVCSVTGEFNGGIVIDAGDDYKFELELCGVKLYSAQTSPIIILSGDKVTLTAKKDTENFIYDTRSAVDENDETAYSSAVYAKCDLSLGGKGSLTVISEHNNGIHTKDDLKVKNLTLSVTCEDNALKGNDSVEIESGSLTLIARTGDGIKTSNTDISSKGNQRGTVSVLGGTIRIYAACDGIDAAYNAEISGEADIAVYTDKYSSYSETVNKTEDVTGDGGRYIRFTSQELNYSVKYVNNNGDYVWANAVYKKSVNSGFTTYYYYAVDTVEGYDSVIFYLYYTSQTQGQDEDYLACSDAMTWNSAYDTFALENRNGSLYYSWANMGQESSGMGGMGGGPGGGPGGMGGMNEGNSDKGDYSTKGIKAGNEILISGGTIYIKAYDDAIHTNSDGTLENGAAPTGNILISGGSLTLYSCDDGIHADGTLTVSGGSVSVTNSYEGLEGLKIVVTGGDISVISSDDGFNATTTSGIGIQFKGGKTYVYAGGDGLDSNSRTSYQGIVFDDGDVTVISTSSNNSSLDTESGYAYNGGTVLALCPSNGMGSESTNCKNFSSVGTKSTLSLSKGQTLTVKVNSKEVSTVEMPCQLNALVIYLGSTKASFSK